MLRKLKIGLTPIISSSTITKSVLIGQSFYKEFDLTSRNSSKMEHGLLGMKLMMKEMN